MDYLHGVVMVAGVKFFMCWLEHVDMRCDHVSTALLGIVCNLGLGMHGP